MELRLHFYRVGFVVCFNSVLSHAWLSCFEYWKLLYFILLLFRKIKHNLAKMFPLFLNTVLDWETNLVVFAPLPQWFLNPKDWKVQYSLMLIEYLFVPIPYRFSPVCDVWNSVSIFWDELHSCKCFAVLNCALK